MPYVITTTTPFHRDPGGEDPLVDRAAVATLVDAEYDVELLIEEHGGSIDEWPDIPEDGGTIGPLPDGAVIGVEPRSVELLLDDLGEHELRGTVAELCDRWNQAQS